MSTGQENIQTRQGMSPQEISAMVAKLVQDGHAQTKLQELFEDNFKLRGKNAELTAKVTAFEEKAPKTGDIVITGTDVALFNQAKEFGKDAAGLKALVEEHTGLSTQVKDLKRKTVVSEIAEAEGWKPNVLDRLTAGMDLAGIEEFEEEIDDPDKPGEKKKEKFKRGVVSVKDSSGNVSKKRLVEELNEFLPSLNKEGKESVSGTVKEGTPMPRMSRGDKAATGGTKDLSTNLIQKRYGTKKKED